jgi:hypothetical protein
MFAIILALLLAVAGPPVFARSEDSSLKASAVPIPGCKDGVGLDDVNFSKNLHKVLLPAGRTGKLYMIDPSSFAMTSVEGFSSSNENKKGQKVGISSADEGEGFLFAADHGTHKLDAVSLKTGMTVASVPLAGDTDFVRYIGANHEVWVTEMDEAKRQIEVFTFAAGDKPVLSHALDIPVEDGPESLTIDHLRNRAYTNLGKQAAAIDVKTHTVISQWPNGCEKSRGTAVDEARGFLFVGCGEGKAVVLDLNRDGKEIGRLVTGAGVDLIDYNANLSHLYITGSKSATLSVLGVSPEGELSLLGTGEAAERSHCVAGDDQNNIWVCDPKHGQLLRYKDTYSAVK